MKAQIPKSNSSADVDDGDKAHRNYFTLTVGSDSSSNETWYSDLDKAYSCQEKSHPDGLSNLHFLKLINKKDAALVIELFSDGQLEEPPQDMGDSSRQATEAEKEEV